MQYLEAQLIFYYSFFNQINANTTILGNVNLFDNLCKIFRLSSKEIKSIEAIINNPTFLELSNYVTANFYINSLELLKGAKMFGTSEDEKLLITNHCKGIELYSQLANADQDILSSLANNLHNKTVVIIFALLHFLKTKTLPEKYLIELKKLANLKQNPSIDSIILLLTIDKTNKALYSNLLKTTSHFHLYNQFDRFLEITKE